MHYIACSNKRTIFLHLSVAFPKNLHHRYQCCVFLVPPYVICVDLSGLCLSRQEHLKGGNCKVKSLTPTDIR